MSVRRHIFWTNTFEKGIEIDRGEQALVLHRGSLKRFSDIPPHQGGSKDALCIGIAGGSIFRGVLVGFGEVFRMERLVRGSRVGLWLRRLF